MTDLSMVRGDDKTINLTFQENGSALNISGGTVFLTIKNKYEDSDTNAIYVTENSTHTVAISGTSSVTINSGSSINFTPGDFKYDIQYKAGGGTISTPARGKFTVYPDVTRRIT